jgi:hypothetical protein
MLTILWDHDGVLADNRKRAKCQTALHGQCR